MDSESILLVKPALFARRAITPPEDDDELVAAGDAYATVRGQRQAEGLRFRRLRRRSFTLLYDYRPIPWWESPGLLLLEYPGLFTTALHGQLVIELEPLITDRRLTWLRECSQAEAATLPIAVTRIDILHSYPSREEEAIGHDP